MPATLTRYSESDQGSPCKKARVPVGKSGDIIEGARCLTAIKAGL